MQLITTYSRIIVLNFNTDSYCLLVQLHRSSSIPTYVSSDIDVYNVGSSHNKNVICCLRLCGDSLCGVILIRNFQSIIPAKTWL